MATYHGANIGHGYVKYALSTDDGERCVTFPALVAPAQRTESLRAIPVVDIHNGFYWVGDDALLSRSPLTLRSQERLKNFVMIPALVRAALDRLELPHGGACVTGLPAAWITESALVVDLASRLREGAGVKGYFRGDVLTTGIRVIAEPLGALFGEALDEQGQFVGGYQHARVGVIDLGHNTADWCIVDKLTVVPDSLASRELGSAAPLQALQARLSGVYGVDLSLYEVDRAIRAGCVKVAGDEQELPHGWDRAWLENGKQLADMTAQLWGNGARLDRILLAGGGAEMPQLIEALQTRYRHTVIAHDPQQAIARGYVRRARRYEEVGA